MAMAVDSRQQLNGLPYEQMRYTAPHFTNPWVSGPATASHLYATSIPQGAVSADHARSTMTASTNAGTMSYQPTAPLPAMSMPTGIESMEPIFPQQAGLQQQDYTRTSGATYPTSAATAFTAAPTSNAQYPTSYADQKLAPFSSFQDRRPSHPLQAASEAERSSFNDALDASRGMVAMSQDITPRNIYGNQGGHRNSTDSYGFPSAHSAHSSISSASTYPTYYNSSVSEASYGDYSSASESVDIPSRTLPRPNGLIAGQLPPAPQSMMGQFSSKVSTSSQKKHKCKICDKRFTRPSSLQTHMYSHTGEKPFACDVEGCGRHFSVVSNLRRHKKVHKGEPDHPSPDDD